MKATISSVLVAVSLTLSLSLCYRLSVIQSALSLSPTFIAQADDEINGEADNVDCYDSDETSGRNI